MTVPTDDVFFSKTEEGKPDVEFLKDYFYREGRIKEEHALYIIHKATQQLRAGPNVLTIDGDAPVMVCGNIHGQYYDLMKLFELCGHPSNTHYLFLGDYISRGHFSIECLLYLWALKICYPNSFFLLRGHHECRRMAERFTFEIECKHKYSERVYEACLESFDTLPLVAIIAKRYFCVHGGISPNLHTIDDIRKLNRFCEPPMSGLMCDILWSDPIEDFDKGYTTENFVHNSVRGVSYFYTYKAVCDFLKRNRLVSIIRTHSVPAYGYRTHRKRNGNPSVITIVSALNCDGRKNGAAVLSCHRKKNTVQQFNWSPHPLRLPKFMDAFSWSLPFICEKVMDMLAVVLYIYFLELNESIQNSTLSVARVDRDKVGLFEMLQNKILAVRCISYMFSVFRVGSEHVSEVKTFLRSSSLRDGVVSLRAKDIKKAIKSLNEARILDEDNKRLPTIKRQVTFVPSPLPNAKDSAGERVASVSASAAAGATPMTPFMRTKEGGELVAKELNTEVQDRGAGVRSRKAAVSKKEVIHRPEEAPLSSEHFEVSDEPPDTSHYETEPRTNRATAGIQEIEKQLQEKERGLQIREAELQGGEAVLRVKEQYLQIREADVQDVENVLRVKERDLQSRESEVQKMLQAVNERREAMDLQEDNLRQRLAAMEKWEENLPEEATLMQQMTTARQPNGAAWESDLFSTSSLSTIGNSPRIHTNVDLKSHAELKEDSEYFSNE